MHCLGFKQLEEEKKAIRTIENVASWKQNEIGCKWWGRGLKSISMCLKSVFDLIFHKITFEIEHYECKSWMMHANEGVGCGCVG